MAECSSRSLRIFKKNLGWAGGLFLAFSAGCFSSIYTHWLIEEEGLGYSEEELWVPFSILFGATNVLCMIWLFVLVRTLKRVQRNNGEVNLRWFGVSLAVLGVAWFLTGMPQAKLIDELYISPWIQAER